MNLEQRCNAALKAAGISELDPLTTHSVRILNRVFREREDAYIADRAIHWCRRTYLPANGPIMNCEYIEVVDQNMRTRIMWED